MAAAGWTANVDRFPDPNNPGHLASLDFTPMNRVTDQHRHRANAIRHRRTDRLPFAAPRNWESFEPRLRDAVVAGTVQLDVIADELRPELARASRLTESLRQYDSSYHTELSWWTGHFETSDGIPRSSLVSAVERDRVDVGRAFPVSPHDERPAGIGQDQSAVLVLSTDEDSRDDALRCGEALSAVLLECTFGRHGDMHTEPSHGATVQPPSHRHLDRTGSCAATSDPRRRSPCRRGTPRDTAAASTRCSDVSPRYMRRMKRPPVNL
jgi:hypothetical protein